MTERKHTPGPWRLEQDTTLVWGACNPGDTSSYGMGYPIAECRVTPASSLWAKGPDYDEGEANARLIAAAPDMLDALKYVAERIRGSDEWWMDCPDKGGFDLDLIESAIAKAEGK